MEKKINFSKMGMEFSEKQLTLSMDVDTTAGPCAEALDFYQRAVVTESNAENFNNVPGNKGKKRIPVLTAGHVLKPWTCTFTGQDIDLSAKEVEVDKFAVMIDICIADIEDSFLVDQMLPGANNNVNPASFLSYVWKFIGEQAGADIETLRWLGDKSVVATDPFLGLTDGYLTLLEAAPALAAKIDAAATITQANVIAEILKVIAGVDPILRNATGLNQMKLFVSSDVALAFAAATASSTAMGSYITNTGDMFLGRFQLIEVPVYPARTMVAGPRQDFIYTYDLLNDKDNFITIDRRQYAGDEVIRFRVNIYMGFDVYDYTNVVYYRPAP